MHSLGGVPPAHSSRHAVPQPLPHPLAQLPGSTNEGDDEKAVVVAVQEAQGRDLGGHCRWRTVVQVRWLLAYVSIVLLTFYSTSLITVASFPVYEEVGLHGLGTRLHSVDFQTEMS